MNKMKLFLTITLLFSFQTFSFAAQSIDGQDVTYVGTGWGAEGIYVRTVANNTSADGCGPIFLIGSNHPMLKEMTSILLSAFHAGSKVNLYVNGCASGNTMQLHAVTITK